MYAFKHALQLPTAERKKCIWYYINEENEDEKTISPHTLNVLTKAFVDCTLPTIEYFPELRPTPRKKDITFLSYIPQSSSSTTSEILNSSEQHLKIKGGSKQKYVYNPSKITKKTDRGRKR